MHDVAALAAHAPKPFRELVTTDLRATELITIETRDLIDGRGRTRLGVRKGLAGVELSEGFGSREQKARIAAGTSFRMQFSEGMGEPFGLVRSVTFQPPCSAPCAAGERRCARDGICYLDYPMQNFCLSCSGAPPQRCACMAPGDSTLPDGAKCTVFGGQPWVGECRAGSCRLPKR